MYTEKSHVAFENKICVATGKKFQTQALLLDKRLRPTLERDTVTGWGVSPEIQEKIDEGYRILVECDPEKSEIEPNGTTKPEGAYRTGPIIYLREKVFQDIFKMQTERKIIFIDHEVTKFLEKIQKNETE